MPDLLKIPDILQNSGEKGCKIDQNCENSVLKKFYLKHRSRPQKFPSPSAPTGPSSADGQLLAVATASFAR